MEGRKYIFHLVQLMHEEISVVVVHILISQIE